MYLTVVIPAYNEEKRIGATLESIAEYLKTKSFDCEVIVVNNNSRDKTVEVIQRYQTVMPFLKIINEHRKGKGYAVTTGMLAGKGQYRLFTDADNSTTLNHFDAMAPYLQQGYDVVIGSLAVPGARVLSGGEEPWYRVLLGKLGNKFIQIFAVWGIHDTQRGFKVFSSRAAQIIFPRMTIFGWGFDVEVLAIARKFKFKIKELPVTWKNDPDSKVNVWAYPQVLLQTLKVSWNLLTGRYI